MEIYTNEERAEVLNKAYVAKIDNDDLCSIKSEKEQGIVNNSMAQTVLKEIRLRQKRQPCHIQT